MRISDWSSDVCSSDLIAFRAAIRTVRHESLRSVGVALSESKWPFNHRLLIAAPPWQAGHMIADRVLFIDAEALVLDKPAGLAVHPGPRTPHSHEDMLDALRFGVQRRPSPVHRLDRDTSRSLLLSRIPRAPRRLAPPVANRRATVASGSHDIRSRALYRCRSAGAGQAGGACRASGPAHAAQPRGYAGRAALWLSAPSIACAPAGP